MRDDRSTPGLNCVLCGADNWRALPIPTRDRAMTTSGILLGQPSEREQCMSCGLLRKARGEFLGNTRFYEDQYENYYGRPGVARYDASRYAAMARWMKAALGEFAPARVLDVGCGAGYSMTETASLYPRALIEGLEPSVGNAAIAQRTGFRVYTMRLATKEALPEKFDLIQSNNVLQHVVDPISFLSELSHHLSPGGRIALILPDATEPSSEMLWTDHNYSFRPADVAALAAKAGLKMVCWQPNPPDNNLLNKQLVILAKTYIDASRFSLENVYSPAELFERRADFLGKWQSLDGVLSKRANGYRHVYNFGASMWTWLLAGYCPAYWARVEACLVDGEHGRAIDKVVFPPSEVHFSSEDCVVLGINPVNQSAFAQRLASLGAQLVSWSDQIQI